MIVNSGLGAISLSALAQLANSGSFNPQYISGNTIQTPAGLTLIPSSYYLDNGSTQQIASALGGSVVQLPLPEAGYQPTTGSVPLANYISVGGTVINAASIAQEMQGTPSFGSSLLCAREQMLSYVIPGSGLDSGCSVDQEAAQTVVPDQNVFITQGPNAGTTVATSDLAPIKSVPASQVAVAQAGVISSTTNPATGGNDATQVDQLSTLTNDFTTAVQGNTAGIPNWALAGGALLLLVVMMKR